MLIQPPPPAGVRRDRYVYWIGQTVQQNHLHGGPPLQDATAACARRRQVEATNNVTAQSLHTGEPSLRQQCILGNVDINSAAPAM